MKKVILILLLIMPVAITVIAYILAGFIAREIQYFGVDSITVRHGEIARTNGDTWFLQRQTEGQQHSFANATSVYVGDTIDLRYHLILNPSRARFEQLSWEISNTMGGATGEEITWNESTGIVTFATETNGWIELTLFYAGGDARFTLIVQTGIRVRT